MKVRKFIKHLPLIFVGFAMSAGVFINVNSLRESKAEETQAYYTPSTHYSVSDTASELSSYYSSISDSDSGTSLLSKLQTLNSNKRKRTVGYSGMGTSTSGAFIYTDYDLNSVTTDSNGQKYGTKVASFYTKTAATSWNREHVWPNSHGGDNVEADILHTRPTISSENSSRGNSFYVEGVNSSSEGWDPYKAGYDAECRGECARIILYSVVASSSLKLSDVNKITSGQSGYSNTMGNMNTLIKWHFEYSPNIYEINRNNGAEYLQGNRNPFVDHPEYVARIWSDFNSTVSNLCTQNASMYNNWTPGSYSNYGENNAVDNTGVTINKVSESIAVDGTTTISATSSDSSAITWTTSNSSIASISTSSTASGGSITVTGVAEGTATITAKATISGTQYTKTCAIIVTTSGGQQTSSDYSILPADLDTSYPTSATSYTAESGISFTAFNTANFGSKIQFKKSGGYLYNNASLNLSTLTINGLSGTLTVYAGTTSNPSSTTITGSNGVYNLSGYKYFKIINSSSSVATCTSIDIETESSSTKTLSSISVSTAPTKTSYTVGQYFDPTGLVIQRNYSDSTHDTYSYAGHTSEFSFNPSLTTALAVSNTSVTITFSTKSCNQAITVTQPVVSSISASVNKTFYVGDIISSSDITVKDNNNNTVSSFTFANDGYQFTYSDAASGGAITNKTFTNAITGSNKTCNLTVQVQRKSRTNTVSVSDTLTADKFAATSTSYINFSGVTDNSSAVYAGQNANNNGNIQLRTKSSDTGIVSTISGGTIKSVSIEFASSNTNTVGIYGKNTAYSDDTDLFDSSTQGTLIGSLSSDGTINFTSSYSYVGIRSSSGAVYISSIVITYNGGDSALNLANYIMYEDTVNQCLSKLSTAIGYLENLSSGERSTFSTSNDYVISTARERLNAWANSQGKTINYSSGTMSNRSGISMLNSNENNGAVILVITISLLGVSSIAMYFYLRKKHEN